jgi:hypothetical protein
MSASYVCKVLWGRVGNAPKGTETRLDKKQAERLRRMGAVEIISEAPPDPPLEEPPLAEPPPPIPPAPQYIQPAGPPDAAPAVKKPAAKRPARKKTPAKKKAR